MIKGIHHLTATAGQAPKDYHFYTQVLGLRLVKQTVNFDDPHVYHFYYGDEIGRPGTIMTTFPYAGRGVRRGTRGTGQVAVTAFSVPSGSLDFWQKRLMTYAVPYIQENWMEQLTLRILDPSGLELALVGNDEDDREPWTAGGVPVEAAIRGLHSVRLSIDAPQDSFEFLRTEMGMMPLASIGNVHRYAMGEGYPGELLDVIDHTGYARGYGGLGTLHHVAFRIADATALGQLRHRLAEELSFSVTEIKDRKYFQSIYFRMPGKVLFEMATEAPGFSLDEPVDQLGHHLMLPEWAEKNRSQIEEELPAFR